MPEPTLEERVRELRVELAKFINSNPQTYDKQARLGVITANHMPAILDALESAERRRKTHETNFNNLLAEREAMAVELLAAREVIRKRLPRQVRGAGRWRVSPDDPVFDERSWFEQLRDMIRCLLFHRRFWVQTDRYSKWRRCSKCGEAW